MKILIKNTLIISIALSMLGCSTVQVKSAQVIDVVQETNEIAEAQLLDVGVRLFNPGLAQESDEEGVAFPEIRIAESSYFPYLLMETIASSSAWGAVRVVPQQYESVDVLVDGKIIVSDGEALIISISVTDALGNHWFTKQYSHVASRYSYQGRRQRLDSEPFQTIYNQIANDLNAYRKRLTPVQAIELRQVSEMKFAQFIAPKLYDQYLATDPQGRYRINRLPAENDPMMVRIRGIRERDQLFVDTLQQYYDSYARQMKTPYQQWRRESYHEVTAMHKLQRQGRTEKMVGAVAIIAGILGISSSSSSGRLASTLAVTAGSYVVKSGFDRGTEAQIHVEALQELGDSLQASIEPHIIELEGRTITLTGTVNNQYQQWRKVLQQIYQLDRGDSHAKTLNQKTPAVGND